MDDGAFSPPLNYLEESELRAGDVLLCYSSELRGKSDMVEFGYSHVAICLSKCRILEAASPAVGETSLSRLLASYSHIAVLRADGCWDDATLSKLHDFASECIGKPFNAIGIAKVADRKADLFKSADERVQAYFSNGVTIDPIECVYFCSELVTSALIYVGIIHRSAAPLFDPKTLTPEDIGKDRVFGRFVGYIVPDESAHIPETDLFFNSLL